MSPSGKQIKILGSGPSGMAAAINLAIAGYVVDVYERNDRAAARYASGWQILENYSEKINALHELESMNIPTDFFHSGRKSVDFYDHKLNKFEMSGKDIFGYFIKRGSGPDCLDSCLHENAVKRGVKMHYGTSISERDADIIAGGSKIPTGISKEIVFDSNHEDVLITILDNNIAPLGFSYIFIINGRGTIGTAILKDFKNIHNYSDTSIGKMKQLIDLKMENIEESVSPVSFFIPHTAVSNNKLYVGEAAGFQDMLFGLGIRSSLVSGYLAAKSIIEEQDFDSLWKEKLLSKMSNGISNRFLYEKLGDNGLSLALRVGHKLDFQKIGLFLNQNPIAATASKFLMPFWKNNSACQHGSKCRWCRKYK